MSFQIVPLILKNQHKSEKHLPMKNLGLLFSASIMLAFVSCNDGKKEADDVEIDDTVQVEKPTEAKEAPKTLSVLMEPKSDSKVQGEAFFSEENGVVRMEAKFTGMTPGKHAIHLHEKADCSAADGTSAGGHWNPTLEKHGKWGDATGYHKGDIGNFEANDEGNGKIIFETEEWCIGCEDEKKNIVGKSIIVHQGVDDYVSQPTGDAGGRVSCGGVIK